MNSYTAVVNLTKAPEVITIGEREVVKLRLADNTFGKGTLTRFFDALVGGPDFDIAAKLSSGDQVCITGTLTKTQYKAKKGKMKGKMVESDSMPFAKLLQVTKSDTAFAAGDDDTDDGAEGGPTEEPDLGGDGEVEDEPGDSPLDGIV